MLITATLSHYPVCFGIPPSNFSRRKSPCRRLWLGQLGTHLGTQPMSWVREINMREISLIQNPWAKSRHLVSLSRIPSNTWNHGGFWYQKALQVVTRVDTVILPASKPFFFVIMIYVFIFFIITVYVFMFFIIIYVFMLFFSFFHAILFDLRKIKISFFNYPFNVKTITWLSISIAKNLVEKKKR